MTIIYTPANLANLNNPTTAVTTINANEASVSAAFVSALNTSGDQMLGPLNMNSNQIINLPPPGTSNSPARLADITSATSTFSTLLAANITAVTPNTVLGNPTSSTANATGIAITGTNSIVANCSPTIVSPTITNPNITGSSINLNQVPLSGLAAVSLGGAAASAGVLGVYLASPLASGLGASNAQVINVESITLTPGDWDVGAVFIAALGAGAMQSFQAGIGPQSGNVTGSFGLGGYVSLVINSASAAGYGSVQYPFGPCRIQITSSQTFFLNASAFCIAVSGAGPSNLTFAGQMWARLAH